MGTEGGPAVGLEELSANQSRGGSRPVPSATKTKYLPFNTVLGKSESSVPITRIGPVVYNPSDLILDGKLLNGLCFQVCIGLSMWFIKPRRGPLEGGCQGLRQRVKWGVLKGPTCQIGGA